MAMVVDSSVVLCVLLNEPNKSGVIAATLGEDLIAPGSMDWEIGNALSAMFKRKTLMLTEAHKGSGGLSVVEDRA